MAPYRAAAASAAANVGTVAAVLGAMAQIATGVHGLMFGLVVLLMVLDGCLGGLRADRSPVERYSESEDRRGIRKRAATVVVVLIAFVLDGFFLSLSRAVQLWPGVFEIGWCTLGSLFWAGRIEARSVYRNALAIFGKRDAPRVLQVAADGLGTLSDFAADNLGQALKRDGKPPQ